MAKRCRFCFFFLSVLLQSSLRDAQSSKRQLQDGSQCDSNSVTDLFQTKLWVRCIILQFTNSTKRGHLVLSRSNLHGDVMGWLLDRKQTEKKKEKQHKITGTTRLSQAWRQYTKERVWAEQIYTMHSSTVEHAKHPYTDIKNIQCLTKNNFNTNFSLTAVGCHGEPAEGGAGWDSAGVNTG